MQSKIVATDECDFGNWLVTWQKCELRKRSKFDGVLVLTFEDNSFWQYPNHQRCRLRGIAAIGGNDSNLLFHLSWPGAHGGNGNVECCFGEGKRWMDCLLMLDTYFDTVVDAKRFM